MIHHIPSDATLLIVSDVDGTLLDHGHFPLPPARMRDCIAEQLARRKAPTVLALASSRSLIELVLLQRLLGVTGPLIAEDGGILALDRELPPRPTDDEPDIVQHAERFAIERIGLNATELRRRIRLIDSVYPWPVLADMNSAELASRGFRTPGAVRRAIMSREASVLLDLDPLDSVRRRHFLDTAQRYGVQVKRGGRWCTAVSGADKGRALHRLRLAVARRFRLPLHVVAIGNEENDAALLAQADLPLIIRNPGRGHHRDLLAVPNAIPLEDEGTAGFLEMFRIINERAGGVT